MPLEPAVQGSLWPPQLAVWEAGDEPANLANVVAMTGKMRNRATGATRAITGTITVTDAATGEFRWQYSEADVAEAGEFDVEFTVAFTSGPGPGKSYLVRWSVKGSLS